jgi:hypothetical protein
VGRGPRRGKSIKMRVLSMNLSLAARFCTCQSSGAFPWPGRIRKRQRTAAVQDAGAPAMTPRTSARFWSACAIAPLFRGHENSTFRHHARCESGAIAPQSKTLARGSWSQCALKNVEAFHESQGRATLSSARRRSMPTTVSGFEFVARRAEDSVALPTRGFRGSLHEVRFGEFSPQPSSIRWVREKSGT